MWPKYLAAPGLYVVLIKEDRMECYLFAGAWGIIGVFSIISHWRKTLDVTVGQILPLILFGVSIGPIVGFLCLASKFIKYIWPSKLMRKILIKKKNI